MSSEGLFIFILSITEVKVADDNFDDVEIVLRTSTRCAFKHGSDVTVEVNAFRELK